jgi:hypothetical protein
MEKGQGIGGSFSTLEHPDSGREDGVLRGIFPPRALELVRRSLEACLELDALLGQSLEFDVLLPFRLSLALLDCELGRELVREGLLTGGKDGLRCPLLNGSGGQLPLRDLSPGLRGALSSSSDTSGLGGNHS